MSRKQLAILLTFVAMVTLVAGIAHQVLQEREQLSKIQSDWAQRNYQELKTNKKTHTSIISPENMLLVANDPECAQRLTYVHFDMTNLEAPEFELVQKLSNVKTLTFL